MAGYDPRLDPNVNTALAMRGLTDYRVPGPPPMVPLAGGIDPLADPVALQNADLAAAQSQDLQMGGLGPSPAAAAYTPDPGMSPAPPLPAPVPAVDPNAVSSGPGAPEESLMSMPADMSYPGEAPAAAGPPAPPGAPGAGLRYMRPRAGAAGMSSNPVPGMLKETRTLREAAAKGAYSREVEGDTAQEQIEDAERNLADTRRTTLEDISKVQQRAAGEAAGYDSELGALQDAHQKATAKVEAEQREHSKFMAEYEPKDRRSTAQKVTSALAVAFSGLADQANLAAGLNLGLNVQTNRAAQMSDMIQRGIDRDLEQQQMMLDNARTAHAAKGTELGQLREKFGDDVDTLRLGKAMKLDQAIQEIEGLKTRGLSAEQADVADRTIGELRQRRADAMLGVSEQRFQKYRDQENQLAMVRWQQQQAARPRGMSPMEALKLQEQALKNRLLQQQTEGGGMPPSMYALGDRKPSEKTVEKAIDLVSQAEGYRGLLQQLRARAMRGGTTAPTDRAMAEAEIAAAKSQFNLVLGDQSAPNEAQLQALDDVFLNPTHYGMADREKVFENLDRLVQNQTRRRLGGMGIGYDAVDMRPE